MGVIRKTKSVKTILKQFERGHDAKSVTDLVSKLSEQMNKTTVYRILERLEDEGTLHSFIGKGGLKWYALCKDCSAGQHQDVHPHFQCSECGMTECLTVDVTIPTIANHKIDAVELLLIGQCNKCLTKTTVA